MNVTRLKYNGAKELAALLEKNEKLRLEFEDYVWDCTNNWLWEYAETLCAGKAFRVQWGMDTETNWEICDQTRFLSNCHKFVNDYGDCAVTDKEITHAQKLLSANSNLAEWYVRLIADKMTEIYFQRETQYLEDAFWGGDREKMLEICNAQGSLFLECTNFYKNESGNVVRLVEVA